MASKGKGLATGLAKWLKKPWEVTGPVAGPEYVDPLPMAGVYRKNSPATQPKRAIVPHAEPEHVFDIKYYVRDTRRKPPTTIILDVPANGTFEGTAPAAAHESKLLSGRGRNEECFTYDDQYYSCVQFARNRDRLYAKFLG